MLVFLCVGFRCCLYTYVVGFKCCLCSCVVGFKCCLFTFIVGFKYCLCTDIVQGFFLGFGEYTRRPSKGEKCTTKAIFGENFLWMLFYIILYLCDPNYSLLYYPLYRYLVSLYQIIWTTTYPENGGFWKTYLDKEKMLVTSSFSCYYNVFYSTLTKFNFCHLQMPSIWTYQKFCHLVWRYEALKYTGLFFMGRGRAPGPASW